MQQIINQIHKTLIKRKKTVSVAESCTGGLTSSLLTGLSGSSAYFILGVVAYHNKTKQELLKIPTALIAREGAVSFKVAKLMAASVRKIANTDLGVGITGIAGPTGMTARKPVGTVFIAVCSKDTAICKKFLFKGSRDDIRKSAALKSLELLKTIL